MAFGVIEKKSVAAKTNEALNRAGVAAYIVENGMVFKLGARSADGVWTGAAPTTGNLTGLWMAGDSGKIVITSGLNEFGGLTDDPSEFSVKIGRTFSIFKPQLGDIIMLSADALTSGYAGADYVVATNTEKKLKTSASAVTGLSLKLIETGSIKIASKTFGTPDGVTAYRFEVAAV